MPILFFSWKSSRALFCTSGVFKHLSLLSCCPLTSEIPHQQKRDHIFSSSLLSSEICSAAAAEALGSRETAGVQSAALIIPPPASSASLVPAIVGKLLENGARVSLGLPQALLWCHTGLIPAGGWTQPGVWGHWISGMWAQLRLCQLTSGAENHLAQGQSSHFLGSLRLANSIISCLACGSFSSQSLHCLQKQAQLLAGNKRIPEIIERLGLERTEWFGFTGTLVSFQPRAMGRDAYNMEINFNLTIEC